MKRGELIDIAKQGLSAVVGLLAFVGAMYGGATLLWLAIKAPDAFSIVAGASIVGAALFFRKPFTINVYRRD